MPITHEHTTPQHQVLINQSILKRMEIDIKKLKTDIDEIKEAILFIRKYTEIKKTREDAKWF
jgi:hypothetical protein|tara:strand:+ start:1514 stop:1699 length:186 start_codon:yes stop_codon:yes gene_type:complete